MAKGKTMSAIPHQKYTVSTALFGKYPTSELVLSNLDAITESLRDEVFEISVAAGKARNFYPRDFDDAYSAAIRVLEGSLAKNHLVGTKRCKSSSAPAMVRWIRQRLISSVKNCLTNEKDKNFIPNFTKYTDSYATLNFDSADQIRQFEIESDLLKIDREEIEKGLNFVWSKALTDLDFDWIDFVDLCEKYGFDANKISKSKSKAEIDEEGLAQLVFDFEAVL